MVTRSNVNWKKHLEDVRNVVRQKYGNATAESFYDIYKERYDKFGRSFLDYKLAVNLIDEYHFVERVGTRFVALVGPGGSGKSTLAQNIAYFFDPSFKPSLRGTTKLGYVMKMMHQLPKRNAMKAIVMDEPDDIHPNSRLGKMVADVFGKSRQQSLFLFMCSTDLTDIPTTFYRKLHTIIFCPYAGRFLVFKNRPDKGEFVVQQIRMEYAKKGYKVFFQLKKSAGCLVGDSHKYTPFDGTEAARYIEDKKEDYANSIKDILDLIDGKKKGMSRMKEWVPLAILAKKKLGLNNVEIGKMCGLHESTIRGGIKTYGSLEES